MKLRRYIDFLNESVNRELPITIETVFSYDENLSVYVGDTPEEKLINMFHEIADDIYDIKEPKVKVLTMDSDSGGWPEIEVTFKSLDDAEKALYMMWANDEWMIYTSIANAMIEDDRERDAFDYLKEKGESEYFNDVYFSEEFMKNLPKKDKDYLRSLKGIEKYSL